MVEILGSGVRQSQIPNPPLVSCLALGKSFYLSKFLFADLSHWLRTFELQKVKEEMYLNGLEPCSSAKAGDNL